MLLVPAFGAPMTRKLGSIPIAPSPCQFITRHRLMACHFSMR
jgi:hypothetical protein